MSCILNSGYALDCADGIGGLKTIYIGNFNSGTTYAVDVDNQITGITSGATYYTYEVPQESASYTETATKSIENGTLFFTQTLSFPINGYSKDERNLMLLLAKAKTTIIALTQSGQYILLGENNGMNMTTGEGGSGQAYGDRLGLNFTFEGKEPENGSIITSAAFATLTVSA
jgi:hypothetical protein